jgi:UDPglucose 6-dehydrogenase
MNAVGAGFSRLGYAGLSHLGIVSSAAAAAKGFDVVGYDPDASLCEAVAAGRPPLVEPGLPDLLRSVGSRLTLTADSSSLATCDIVYVSIDVPTDDSHRGDLSAVGALVERVVSAAKRGTAIVILSQVPPGFTRSQRERVEAAGKDLELFYQVETLVFGRAVERAMHPERFIVGCADPAEPLPPALASYLAAFGCPVLPMRYESAELCKISINMFLVSSISTTNMLAGVSEAIGAEWREIAPALRLDARIGQHAYLTPGLGIGGGNLTRDLETIRAIASETGTDAGLVGAWLDQSTWRRDWALRELHGRVLAGSARPRIAIWGVAYKENTQSTKNSPSLALIRTLRGFDLAVFDPEARLDPDDAASVEVAGNPIDACRDADALAVMTPWPLFSAVDLRRVAAVMRGRTLIDPFGIIDAAAAGDAGFEYTRLGSGAERSPQKVSC